MHCLNLFNSKTVQSHYFCSTVIDHLYTQWKTRHSLHAQKNTLIIFHLMQIGLNSHAIFRVTWTLRLYLTLHIFCVDHLIETWSGSLLSVSSLFITLWRFSISSEFSDLKHQQKPKKKNKVSECFSCKHGWWHWF